MRDKFRHNSQQAYDIVTNLSGRTKGAPHQR